MEASVRNKLIAIGALIFLFVLVKWVWEGPRKSLVSNIQWAVDNDTKKEIPIFSVYYCRNGKEDSNPTWMIFLKNGKWRVIDIREVSDPLSGPLSASNLSGELLNHANNFDHGWIENKQFEGRASRYEVLLVALGFNPLWAKEQTEFLRILDGTKNFDEGRLKPD